MRHCAWGLAILLLITLFFCGCISYDYVGQRLSPLPETEPVQFYDADTRPPEGVFTPLGRATISGPDGTTAQDLRNRLEEEARKAGADAIQVVTFKRTKVGEVTIPKNDPYSNGTVGDWVQTSNRADATPIYSDTFSQNIALQQVVVPRYKMEAKVIFLADKKKFDKALAAYKKARKRYLHEESRFAK